MPLEERRVLNLGSGKRYEPHAVNLDLSEGTSPDVVHDLEEVPWPFPDDRFERARAIDVLEHLSSPLAAREESHRIPEPGGSVEIVVPHCSRASAFTDLARWSFFGWESLDYL